VLFNGVRVGADFGVKDSAVLLSLAVTGIPVDGYAVAYFDLHRLLRDWGEGTRTPPTPLARACPLRPTKPPG